MKKLTVEELNEAEREVLHRVQAVEFVDELKTVSLQSQQQFKKVLNATQHCGISHIYKLMLTAVSRKDSVIHNSYKCQYLTSRHTN